jgi:hypothetical protein
MQQQPDDIIVIQKVLKLIKESYQNIGDNLIAGGIDNMEKIQVHVRTGACLSIHFTGNL